MKFGELANKIGGTHCLGQVTKWSLEDRKPFQSTFVVLLFGRNLFV